MSNIEQLQSEQIERENLVAEWLKATPGFFERHANLLAEISLKNPHGDRAISLQERQLSVLREQNQALNKRLSDMLRFGSQNDKTQSLMIAWLKNLLQAKDEAQVSQAITEGLSEIFGVELVKLTQDVSGADFCGDIGSAPEDLKKAVSEEIVSLALINLSSVGMQLILGSKSAEKFTADMGSFYLSQIGQLGESAIARTKG
jgi:uncharacterized protein YigA (DUF484 family)